MSVTLGMIEDAAKAFALNRNELGVAVAVLEMELAAVKRKHLPKIKRAIEKAAQTECALRGLIGGNAALFEKPRTQVFHDIKVGFRKGSGGIDWDDDGAVVDRIEKHFSKAQAELLIKTTKKPIAKALQDLDVADLKRIGCRVEATGDVVVVKPVDTAVDKVINALLKDAVEERMEEAA